MTKATPIDPAKTGAQEILCAVLKPGDPVYTLVTYCGADGMNRRFRLFMIDEDHRDIPYIRDITRVAALAVGFRYSDDHAAIRINGCGMDMGFHCVYTLGRVLFPGGFTVSKGGHARNGDTSGFDMDGGYAFEHRSL